MTKVKLTKVKLTKAEFKERPNKPQPLNRFCNSNNCLGKNNNRVSFGLIKKHSIKTPVKLFARFFQRKTPVLFFPLFAETFRLDRGLHKDNRDYPVLYALGKHNGEVVIEHPFRPCQSTWAENQLISSRLECFSANPSSKPTPNKGDG